MTLKYWAWGPKNRMVAGNVSVETWDEAIALAKRWNWENSAAVDAGCPDQRIDIISSGPVITESLKVSAIY